jgi:hypothetical protein
MKIEAAKGVSIYHAAEQAVAAAVERGTEVHLVFNDITVHVDPRSFPDDIAYIYNLKSALRRASQ